MDAPAYPKRFYKTVTLEKGDQGWHILLDGRSAKTPGKHTLHAFSESFAAAIAEEWDNQETEINPYTMPLTQRRMIVLDRAENDLTKWREIILSYLGSDLLCYRADHPEELVKRQKDVWQPYLDWFGQKTGVLLESTIGVISVSQPEGAMVRTEEMLQNVMADVTSCLAGATEVTGSAVLALALWHEVETPDDIFSASRLDERFQAEKWGVDSEAAERERKLKRDFLSIARYLKLVQAEV